MNDVAHSAKATFRSGKGYQEFMRPEVSVVIPAYNQAALLLQTIDAVLGQTYPPAEIIVVDDGSTDNTPEVMANPHPKVMYRRTKNSRVCAARNLAVSLSKSPYIAFCDQDDLWRVDKLEKQMRLHLEEPELEYSFTNYSIVKDGVWTDATKFDQVPAGFFEGSRQVFDGGMVSAEPFYKKLLRSQPIFPSTLLMTRAFFDRIGGFYNEVGNIIPEDWEFTLRCVLNAGKVGYLTEPVVGIRKHANNTSGNNLATSLGEIEILKFILIHHPIDEISKALVVNEMARRRILASYDAFSEGKFALCNELLTAVPTGQLTPKLWAKLLTSRSPDFLAKRLHRVLTSLS